VSGTLLLPDDFGMVKICQWGAWRQDGLVSEPLVRKLGHNRVSFDKLAKLQSKDTASLVQEFLDTYHVKKGHAYFLDTALGACEAWGSNNNGDAFREREDLLLESDDHGYKSFRKHAHVFRHHKNKDPSRAMGKVVLAAYNKTMRRVELIEEQQARP